MVAVLFALVTPNVFLGAQFQRYVLWAFPGLLALAAAGLGQATTWAIRDPGRERAAFRGVAVVWVAPGRARPRCDSRPCTARSPATSTAATWPPRSGSARTCPPGTAMANLATSVEYLTGHRNLNLHGVTAPDFFGDHAAEREADAFEGLRRLAPPRAAALPHHHRLRPGPLPHHAASWSAGPRSSAPPASATRSRSTGRATTCSTAAATRRWRRPWRQSARWHAGRPAQRLRLARGGGARILVLLVRPAPSASGAPCALDAYPGSGGADRGRRPGHPGPRVVPGGRPGRAATSSS